MITIKEEFLTDAKTLRAIQLGGHAALTMWLAMKRYCAENSSDGFVPKDVVGSLPGAPQKWRKCVRSLIECGRVDRAGKRGAGLVDEVPGGYELHDYLDHAQSREEIELKREKARIKKRRQRDAIRAELERLRQQNNRDYLGASPGDTARDIARDTHGDGTGTLARAGDPQPSPAQPTQEIEPPNPPFGKRDPFAESLTGKQPHDRADVNELHEAYKRVYKLKHRVWYAQNYHEARTMADAIDAHGLANCLLVVDESPNDGMVSGREDETKAKHESISYIFGNAAAFDRILRSAKERVEKGNGAASITDRVAEMKKRKVS